MWKKAFIVLLLINLLVIVSAAAWLNSFTPTPPTTTTTQTSNNKSASVQLSIGQDAINTYLEYFVSDQAEMSRVLSYARVTLNTDWEGQLGIKLADRVIDFDIVFVPTIVNGNVDLQIKSATMGQLPIPPSLIFLIFKHLPWPFWISLDSANQMLDINLTERPQKPYGVEIVSYSPQTRLLTLLVSIVPKAVLSHRP